MMPSWWQWQLRSCYLLLELHSCFVLSANLRFARDEHWSFASQFIFLSLTVWQLTASACASPAFTCHWISLVWFVLQEFSTHVYCNLYFNQVWKDNRIKNRIFLYPEKKNQSCSEAPCELDTSCHDVVSGKKIPERQSNIGTRDVQSETPSLLQSKVS